MAYDEQLARRVRPLLARRRGFAEKKMFGGVGYFLHGNICVGVWKEYLIADWPRRLRGSPALRVRQKVRHHRTAHEGLGYGCRRRRGGGRRPRGVGRALCGLRSQSAAKVSVVATDTAQIFVPRRRYNRHNRRQAVPPRMCEKLAHRSRSVHCEGDV